MHEGLTEQRNSLLAEREEMICEEKESTEKLKDL